MKYFSAIFAILLLTSNCGNEEQIQNNRFDQDESNIPNHYLRPTPFDKKLKGAVIIASLKGDVSVINLFQSNESEKNNAAPETLKAGEIVLQGSTIVSGKNSEVDLLFTNGTSAKVGSNSKLTISAIWQKSFQESEKKVSDIKEETSATRIDLDLEIGDLIVDVKKLKKESSFRVNSPLGVAGIRGTQFRIFIESKRVELSVLEGDVSFWNQDYGEKEISNLEKFVLETNNEPILKPLNTQEKRTIQGRIISLKKAIESYDLSNLANMLGGKTKQISNAQSNGKKVTYTIKDGLVAWWPFDQDANDLSGNNRHAKAMYEHSYVSGIIGKAIRVVGKPSSSPQGGHVILPFLDWLENGSFSFSLWVKEEEILSDHGEHYLAFGTICHITHTKMKSFGTYVFNFGNDHSYEANLNWDEWNMYTVTYNTQVKIGFLNGKEVTRENTLDPTTVGWDDERYKINGELTPLGEFVKRNYRKAALGKHWWADNAAGSSTRLIGSFDDVRIYDRALFATEVQELYNLGQ
jgi:hypothetical protein